MFSSLGSLSNIRFGFGRSVTSDSTIDLPSVRIHDVERGTERRDRRLKHLLKLNHVNHAILFHNMEFHNHTPHILGSAYILGGDADHLNAIYESEEADGLVGWEDSPGEIARYDWHDYLGKRTYQRAFVDFFEDEVVRRGYDWKAVVQEFLFEGKEPMANNLIAGLGHPLIHLGYAFELDSREVAMEALAMAATNYNYLHKYLDDPRYSKPQTAAATTTTTQYQTTSNPLEVLARIHADDRLDGLFSHPGGGNLTELFGEHESLVLEHWNAWKISEPKRQFEQTQQAAVALLISAAHPSVAEKEEKKNNKEEEEEAEKERGRYDFFLVHLVTTSHAVRILLPFLPSSHHVPLLRQWWLLTVALYMTQLRPRISIKTHILDYDVDGRDWDWVVEQALKGKHSLDAHYVKAVRAMKEAAQTWGDGDDRFYLKAAVRFAAEFDGWGGFSPNDLERPPPEGGRVR